MPLLGPQEKGELEAMILARLREHFEAHGPAALLEPGLRVAVTARGAHIIPGGESFEALAQVEVRTLFTALCYLVADGTSALPADALPSLATEATSATAAQINKLGTGRDS